ncbi:MAG TPA: hypothetical protein ENK04_14150 [Gammaproteobacteria bacterium]|nr:hypothetical protein [Gammaproteobacteria bacterium]
MEQDSAQILIELMKAVLSKPDSTVVSAYITIGGMFGVAAVTAITQWLVTKSIIRSEHERLHTQLSSDFKLGQFSKWQDEFLTTISELLASTDPEVHPEPKREKVVPLIQKAQLLLNLEIPVHRKVNGLINELGLAVNNWEVRGLSEVLGIHGRLLEAARDAIYLPGR